MKKLAIIFGILFIPSISSATPSISNVGGTFNHGETITITGSGFGNKSPAKPLVWADFENISIGSTAAQSSKYSTGVLGVSNTSKVIVTNADMAHARSTKSAQALGSNNINTSGVSGSTHVFTYLKRKWAHPRWFDTLTNFKFFRLWSIGTPGVIDQVVAYSNYSNPYSPTSTVSRTEMTAEFGVVGNKGISLKPHPTANIWGTEEYQTNKSSIDVQDGRFMMWYNGKKVNDTTVKNRTTANPGNWARLYLENFNHHTANVPSGYDDLPAGAYVYYDDVYIDTTWSRVMIGNASTFDACTHREPLIPTAWSTSSITAYFNQGAFSNGQNVYVFVVDSNGNSSPGKKITIGGDAAYVSPPTDTSPAPNPPANLNIN